ncbi:hypothetical protein [Metabacillus fastidiosus]|uniref:hypothetical protein n=1 Tax=Metabacillus fastidiosus TaxID=1458 RepID=UPI002E243BE8|nr:hypothetical protein [Metabacillus fastidiosus]
MNFKKSIVPAALAVSIISSGVIVSNSALNVEAASNQQVSEEKKQQEARITNINVVNTMTLQITFNKPLAAEDVDPNNLENIKKQFEFNHDLSIVNVPRLKTGAKSTYIVPVTFQKDDARYKLSYKGQRVKTFEGTDEKIEIRNTKQVTNDTFELESFLEDGVVDYANVIEAYKAGRGDLAFELDRKNRDKDGKRYDIISSLRDRYVTVTGSNGDQFTANYVPFTQAADGRQAPKFRLPEGQTLKQGVTYKVTSKWADIDNRWFTAENIAPLKLQSAQAIDNKSFQITLDKDPRTELFAGRGVELQGEDGSTVKAQYRFSSRKGAVGIFDVQNAVLKSGVKYKVVPLNNWATAENVSFTAK